MAVIKGNKYNNIPAVLIEHCFISNASDCEQFLSSEEKLRTLGVADANGIMDYLGLNNLKQASDGNWYFIKMDLLIIAIPVWHYIQEIGGM